MTAIRSIVITVRDRAWSGPGTLEPERRRPADGPGDPEPGAGAHRPVSAPGRPPDDARPCAALSGPSDCDRSAGAADPGRRRAEPADACAAYATASTVGHPCTDPILLAVSRPQYPSAQPSLRGSEPPISTPRCQSIADRLAAAERRRPQRHVVPARRRPSTVAAGTPRSTTVSVALEEGARRVDRRLHVHAVIDHVGDDLRVAHRLIVRAHHAERQVAAPVAEGERRDDRVHRPLARPERVRDAPDRPRNRRRGWSA